MGQLCECCENVVAILCQFLGDSHSHATLTTSTPSATLGQACVKGERQGCGDCYGNAVVMLCQFLGDSHSHATLTTSTPSATLGQACVKGERQGCGDCYGNAVVMLCRFCANLLGIPIHILHLLPSIHCQNPNQTPLHSPIRGW